MLRDPCMLSNRRIGVRAFSTSLSMSAGDKKKVVFMGTPDVAAQSLRILLEESKKDGSGFEISAVVSNPARPAGRKKHLQPSPVQALAEDEGLPIFTPSGLLKKFDDSAEFLATMKEIAPDLAITAAYGQFLPNSFLSIPEFGTLNIHPSLLPRYRGASPVPRALEAGVDVTGVSVLFTVLQMDAGPIAAQEEYELNGNEKATDLLPTLFERGSRLLVDTLPAVWSGEKKQDGTGCIIQEEAAVTHAAKMSKEEGELWFTENAKYMHNKVRAFAGWPGTTAELILDPRGKEEEKIKVKIITTRMLRAEGGAVLGVHEIKMNKKGDAMVITCDDGSQLEVLEVQPPNKRAMDAKSFWNGLKGKRVERARVPWSPGPAPGLSGVVDAPH